MASYRSQSKSETDALSVTAFARLVREAMEGQFKNVKVEGEISNFKRHSSGHCYFTLKDSGAQIRCVMWRNVAQALYFTPSDGMQVCLYGRASVYEQRGDLQLVANALRHAGEGALQKAFEALKQTLAAEGLFEQSAKKPLPTLPERIGIITSGTGAAIQDLLSILERRYPLAEVLICPVQVQGAGASTAISEAIEAFNAIVVGSALRVDVLIVGRGGGSIEDLWAFNEEAVARAIFASEIPIVSAVGHESDITISDYVADVRAATPSMAAEIVAPDKAELASYIRGAAARLTDRMLQHIDQSRNYVDTLTQRHGFQRPVDLMLQFRQRLDDLAFRLDRAGPRYLDRQLNHVQQLQQQLALLDPYRPLKKGYVMVEQDGQFVRSATTLHDKTGITLRFHDGNRSVNLNP